MVVRRKLAKRILCFIFGFCFSSAKRRGECSTSKNLATAALSQVKNTVFRCPSIWALLLGNLKIKNHQIELTELKNKYMEVTSYLRSPPANLVLSTL